MMSLWDRDWKVLAKELAEELGEDRELVDRYLACLLGSTTGEDAVQCGEQCGIDLLNLCDQAIRHFSDDPADAADTPLEQDLLARAEADDFFPVVLRFVEEHPLPGHSPFLRRLSYYDSLFRRYSAACMEAFVGRENRARQPLEECMQQLSHRIGQLRFDQFDLCVRAAFLSQDLPGGFSEGMKLVYRDTLLFLDPDTGERGFHGLYHNYDKD